MRSKRYATIVGVLALASSVTFPGCYTYHAYQVGGMAGRELGNQPVTEWKHRTLHALLWGAIRQDIPIDNCQTADGRRFGLEELKIHTDLLYLVVATVTLAIWVPLDVSWRCARPPVAGETLR